MAGESNSKRKMKHVIKWVVNPYRKDKRTGALSPVKRSKYAQMQFEEAENMFKDKE